MPSRGACWGPGHRVGLAENPLASKARRGEGNRAHCAKGDASCGPVRLDPCMRGLMDYKGELINGPTVMLVPKNSCLTRWLEARRAGARRRADAIGRGKK